MLIVLRNANHRELFESQLSNLGMLNSHNAIRDSWLFYHSLLKTFVSDEESDLFGFEKDVELVNHNQKEL